MQERLILHSIMPIYGSSFSLFTAMQILDMYNQVLYNYKNITNVRKVLILAKLKKTFISVDSCFLLLFD